MTKATLDQWMSRITYKPHFRFNHRLVDGFVEIQVIGHVIDIDDRRKKTDIISEVKENAKYFTTFERFRDWLFYQIMVWETHEAKEWFFVDGEKFHEVHT